MTVGWITRALRELRSVNRPGARCAASRLGALCAFSMMLMVGALALHGTPALARNLKVLVVSPADDPRLERSRLERAVPGHALGSAADGVHLALRDAQRSLSQAGVRIEVQVATVTDGAATRAAVAKPDAGLIAVVADLPGALLTELVSATTLPVLNVGAPEDRLRQDQCRANLWHLTPSERMRADAIAQALVARKWTRVLLLTPQDPAQAERVASAQGAIKRFGLKLVDTRTWKLSADPRERDLANPRLLTQGDYDAVWVVDADGEFSTSLPFRTVLPRPVVGDGGVMAVAWSAKYERFGAPQVSRRLQRTAGRAVGAPDWVSWMAGKAVVEMALAAPGADAAGAAARGVALSRLELDGSKGVAMGFRPWDGQLRMPMLLTDGQAVIDTVPGEGVMHPRNRLDTLGADAPENLCRARKP